MHSTQEHIIGELLIKADPEEHSMGRHEKAKQDCVMLVMLVVSKGVAVGSRSIFKSSRYHSYGPVVIARSTSHGLASHTSTYLCLLIASLLNKFEHPLSYICIDPDLTISSSSSSCMMNALGRMTTDLI